MSVRGDVLKLLKTALAQLATAAVAISDSFQYALRKEAHHYLPLSEISDPFL